MAWASAVLVSGILTAEPARAQAENQAAARVLFEDGRRLLEAGRYEEACPKFEAASKLYAGSGVLMNLGDCYEHTNRTASAWTVFGDAAFAASRAGRPSDETEARRRKAALEPVLPRLVIRVRTETPGLVVSRDGTALQAAAWGVAMPVDPGRHAVRAEAPGRESWVQSVVFEPGKTVTLEVPVLGELQTGMPAAQTSPSTLPSDANVQARPGGYWTTRRIVGVAATGSGLISMAVGGALGLAAKAQDNAARTEPSAAQISDSKSAVNSGNVATVIVSAGAVVAAVGLVVWLTAPSERFAVGVNGSTLVLGGAF
jgi:hypothetical protein